MPGCNFLVFFGSLLPLSASALIEKSPWALLRSKQSNHPSVATSANASRRSSIDSSACSSISSQDGSVSGSGSDKSEDYINITSTEGVLESYKNNINRQIDTLDSELETELLHLEGLGIVTAESSLNSSFTSTSSTCAVKISSKRSGEGRKNLVKLSSKTKKVMNEYESYLAQIGNEEVAIVDVSERSKSEQTCITPSCGIIRGSSPIFSDI